MGVRPVAGFFARAVLCVLLVGQLSACSGYTAARLPSPPIDSDSAIEPDAAHVLQPGDSARITLVSGETVEGTVAEAAPDSLVLTTAHSRIARAERTIAREDIRSVQALSGKTSDKSAKYAVIAICISVGVLFLIAHEFGPALGSN
jgi:hypothetical protein